MVSLQYILSPLLNPTLFISTTRVNLFEQWRRGSFLCLPSRRCGAVLGMELMKMKKKRVVLSVAMLLVHRQISMLVLHYVLMDDNPFFVRRVYV